MSYIENSTLGLIYGSLRTNLGVGENWQTRIFVQIVERWIIVLSLCIGIKLSTLILQEKGKKTNEFFWKKRFFIRAKNTGKVSFERGKYCYLSFKYMYPTNSKCPDITPKDITPKADITPKDITPKADITPKCKLRTRKLR